MTYSASLRPLLSTRLLTFVTAIGLSAMVLPAQAAYEDDCKPPKTNYANVGYTDVKSIYVADDKDYNLAALVNAQGKTIISLKGYEDIDRWNMANGIFAVLKNNKVGYMNTQGKLVIPTVYDSLQDPDNKYDETWANPVVNNRIVVTKNGSYGVIDTNNKVILPFNKYAYIDSYQEKMAAVLSESGKWGFINLDGAEVIKPQYDSIYDVLGSYYGFSQGLAAVYNGKKWGFITKSGKVAVPFIYDEIRPFSEGLAGVRKGNKWGFINGANKTVIPFQYLDDKVMRMGVNFLGADHFYFRDGQAIVGAENNQYICIDKSNKKVTCQQ